MAILRSLFITFVTLYAFANIVFLPTITVFATGSAFVVLTIFFSGMVVVNVIDPGRFALLRSLLASIQRVHFDGFTVFCILAGLGFFFLAVLWSPLPERGFSAASIATAAVLLTSLSCLMVWHIVATPTWVVLGLVASIMGGTALVVLEYYSGGYLRGLAGAETIDWRLNRAAVTLALMAPLLFVGRSPHPILFWRLVALAMVWVAAFTSVSESAKLAVIVVTFLLAIATRVNGRHLFIFCATIILGSHLLAPLFGWALHQVIPTQIYADLGYPDHAIRPQIWWAYAQLIWEAPIFGHGLEASLAALDTHNGIAEELVFGLGFAHPHNFSLQVWYELGGVGVALSSLLMFLGARSLLVLSDRQLGLVASLMASVWTVAYVSHGAWQHWWWALVGVLTVLFVTLVKQQCEKAYKPRSLESKEVV